MNILRMVNPVQAYAWGSKTFIRDLLCTLKPDNKPQAELWMGAHPKLPSQILNGDILVNLDYIIGEDPVDFLGKKTAGMYHDQLPFLLKVLAADEPLSIQVHPGKKQAKSGFAYEEKAEIPIEAPHRNYKDTNHKPELLVALTPFHAMCGFREYSELIQNLKKYLPDTKLAELDSFIANPNPENLKTLYSALLKLESIAKDKLLSAYLKNIEKAGPADEQEKLIKDWTIKLNKFYPKDTGILSPLFLNIIVLKPMEGLYLPAGVLHSYLQGAGMEIMANSDNVLRGGLTSKHIDIEELLKAVDFTSKTIEPVKAIKKTETEAIYKTPAEEFALSIIKHASEKTINFEPSGSPEVLFCYEGSFVIENCSQFLTLEKGQSLFVPYEVEGYSIKGTGTIFRAIVNL